MGRRARRKVSDPVLAQRLQKARTLFIAWTGVTNPDLAAALWHNLSAHDRQHWLDLAAEGDQ